MCKRVPEIKSVLFIIGGLYQGAAKYLILISREVLINSLMLNSKY